MALLSQRREVQGRPRVYYSRSRPPGGARAFDLTDSWTAATQAIQAVLKGGAYAV